jgi:hypothetical protein
METQELEFAKYSPPKSGSNKDSISRSITKPEGHLDLYGHHESAHGLFFCGWVSHTWQENQHPQKAVVYFDDCTPVEGALMAFHYRDDVHGRGIGFIFFVDCDYRPSGLLDHIEIHFSSFEQNIRPARGTLCLSADELVIHLRGFLSGGEENSNRRKMLALLLQKRPSAAPEKTAPVTGRVDFYGYHDADGGWFLCGWVSAGWLEEGGPEKAVVSFEDDKLTGEATAVLYPRPDVQGEGIVLFVEGRALPSGSLCLLTFEIGGMRVVLSRVPDSQRLREQELVGRLRSVLTGSKFSGSRTTLISLLGRQLYNGIDTLAILTDHIFLEIDDVIRCGSDSLVLMVGPPDLARTRQPIHWGVSGV